MVLFSSFSLVAGMNMSPVSRLKKTWSKVKTAKFFILEVKKKKKKTYHKVLIHCLNYILDLFVCEFSHCYPGMKCLQACSIGRGPDSGWSFPGIVRKVWSCWYVEGNQSTQINRRRKKNPKIWAHMQVIVLALMPVLSGHRHNAECKAPKLYLGHRVNKAQGCIFVLRIPGFGICKMCSPYSSHKSSVSCY